MARASLPVLLQLALKQHVMSADIHDDEELQQIMGKLTDLNNKIEAVKERARELKAQKHS